MESEYKIRLRGTLKIPSAIPFAWMRRKLADTILKGFEIEIERPAISFEGRITEKKMDSRDKLLEARFLDCEEWRRKEAQQEGIPLQ